MTPLILLTLAVRTNHLDVVHKGHLVDCEEIMGELTQDTHTMRHAHMEHIMIPPIIPVHEDTYEAEFLCHYKWLVYDCVGQEQGPLPDIKNIKVSPLEKYNGEDNIKKFDTWLAGLLRWFQVYNVTGDHKDTVRVDLCGTTLAGLATTYWYVDEVEVWN